MNEAFQVNDIEIKISHPDKLLFPEDGISKEDVIHYYDRISQVLLPYLQDRPLNMQRFPDGIGEEGFYQKEVPDYFPDWIDRVKVEVKEEGRQQSQVICNKAATLLYLANLGCITFHRWLCKRNAIEHPDLMIFDLDPPGEEFEPVQFAALRLYEHLQQAQIQPFVMSTGSRGLHVVIPLLQSPSFDKVRVTAGQIAHRLAQEYPDQLTTEVRKEKRSGRLFLDYLRNAYAQTAVTPYSLRALPGAPVATPLDWDELHDGDLNARSYRMENIFRRLGQKSDPWQEIQDHAQSLESIQRIL
jgi:bifunctional non-homologous end joining protein LigD